MTKLVTTGTVDEINGLVVQLHLDVDDAYETLRTNFADEVPVGDTDGIIESMLAQDISFDVFEHDIDLNDVRAELPDAAQLYRDVYNTLDSHAHGSAAGIEHCACADWSAADGGTYNDHVTQAILTKLGLPTGPTA